MPPRLHLWRLLIPQICLAFFLHPRISNQSHRRQQRRRIFFLHAHINSRLRHIEYPHEMQQRFPHQQRQNRKFVFSDFITQFISQCSMRIVHDQRTFLNPYLTAA